MLTITEKAGGKLTASLTSRSPLRAMRFAVIFVIAAVACTTGGVSAPSGEATPEPTPASTLAIATATLIVAPTLTPTVKPTSTTPPPTSTSAPSATSTHVVPTPTVEPTRTPPIDVDTLLTELLGGETTAVTSAPGAFEIPALNLTNLQNTTFWEGDALFTFDWVVAPSGEGSTDGLRPIYNALSCAACHVRDGKGIPPANDDDPARGLLIRLSVSPEIGSDPLQAILNDPNYGGQIQDRGIAGVPAEGRIKIAQIEIPGQFADGTPFTLLKPVYSIGDLAFGALHPRVMMSPRIASAMVGLGLLEAIPDDVLLAMADPEDLDGDGISGRVNIVPNIRTGEMAIGRFGWKAGQPTVEQQVAGALNSDIGITSSLFPSEDCTLAQTSCQAAPAGGQPEISAEELAKLVLYSRTLAVPAMRDIFDTKVRRGAELFLASGCSECHTPSYVTGEHDIDAMENQVIFPYTDLLLHDMGPGLADDRPELEANGQEWRTSPLWSIGLIERVNGHTRYLHDGRARNLTEAVLWHGGEASDSLEIFKNLSAEERAQLIRFLEAL